ncbi:hypothetical protein ACJX0J_017850 [Zea mays]
MELIQPKEATISSGIYYNFQWHIKDGFHHQAIVAFVTLSMVQISTILHLLFLVVKKQCPNMRISWHISIRIMKYSLIWHILHFQGDTVILYGYMVVATLMFKDIAHEGQSFWVGYSALFQKIFTWLQMNKYFHVVIIIDTIHSLETKLLRAFHKKELNSILKKRLTGIIDTICNQVIYDVNFVENVDDDLWLYYSFCVHSTFLVGIKNINLSISRCFWFFIRYIILIMSLRQIGSIFLDFNLQLTADPNISEKEVQRTELHL